MLFTDVQRSVRLNKRKSPQTLPPIPMKSSTVWHGHSTRPSLPAGTVRKVSGHLSGRRPLHLANARPFGRSKAPLGLLLLRKRELALAGRTGSSCRKRKTGSSRWGTPCLTYRVWIFQGASGCWVFVKQFSRNDTATACQDWLRVPG